MKKKLTHYAEIFAAAFAVTALVNADHLFDAHGLDGIKSVGVAVVVAAAKAGVDAVKAAVGPSK
jgi:predicted short-subunit dehydrogenase-like oxidoreductase (DUF2520 family)